MEFYMEKKFRVWKLIVLLAIIGETLSIYVPNEIDQNPKPYTTGLKIKTSHYKTMSEPYYHSNYSKVYVHNKNYTSSLLDSSSGTRPTSNGQSTKLYPVYISEAKKEKIKNILKEHNTNVVEKETLNNRVVYKRRIEKTKNIEVFNKCPKGLTGQFVYDLACNQYLDCWSGRGGPRNCAPGTLFNPKTLECDFPEKVECLTGPSASSLSLQKSAKYQNYKQANCPEGFSGLIPNYTDCSKFIQCNSGIQTPGNCPPGTLFDTNLNVCNHQHVTTCFSGQSGSNYVVKEQYGGSTDESRQYSQSGQYHGQTGQYQKQTAQYQGQTGQYHGQPGQYQSHIGQYHGQSAQYGQQDPYSVSQGQSGQFVGQTNYLGQGQSFDSNYGAQYHQTGGSYSQGVVGCDPTNPYCNSGGYIISGKNIYRYPDVSTSNLERDTQSYGSSVQAGGCNPQTRSCSGAEQPQGYGTGQVQSYGSEQSQGYGVRHTPGYVRGQTRGDGGGQPQGLGGTVYIQYIMCNQAIEDCSNFQPGTFILGPGGTLCNPQKQNCNTSQLYVPSNKMHEQTRPSAGTYYVRYVICNPTQEDCSKYKKGIIDATYAVPGTLIGAHPVQGSSQGVKVTEIPYGCNITTLICNPVPPQSQGKPQISTVDQTASGQRQQDQICNPQYQNCGQGTESNAGRGYGQGLTRTDSQGRYPKKFNSSTNYKRVCNADDENCYQGGPETPAKGYGIHRAPAVSPKCPEGVQGIIKHPTNCKKFLNCANGITYVQDCGPGTLFNPINKICDFPYNVDCKDADSEESTTINYSNSDDQQDLYDKIQVRTQPTQIYTACQGFQCTQSQFGQGAVQFGQGTSQFGQGTSQFGQGTGQLGQGTGQFAIGQFGQGPGQLGQAIGQFGQTTGQFGQSAVQFGHGHNQFGKGTGQLGQGAGQFGQEIGQFGQGTGQSGQNAVQFGQDRNQFGKGTGQLGQGAGQFGQGTGQFGKGTGQFEQGTGQFGHETADQSAGGYYQPKQVQVQGGCQGSQCGYIPQAQDGCQGSQCAYTPQGNQAIYQGQSCQGNQCQINQVHQGYTTPSSYQGTSGNSHGYINCQGQGCSSAQGKTLQGQYPIDGQGQITEHGVQIGLYETTIPSTYFRPTQGYGRPNQDGQGHANQGYISRNPAGDRKGDGDSHIMKIPTQKGYQVITPINKSDRVTHGGFNNQKSVDYVDIFDPDESRNFAFATTARIPTQKPEKQVWPPHFSDLATTDPDADYIFEYDDGEPVTLAPEKVNTEKRKKSKCGRNDFVCNRRSCVAKNFVCDGLKDCDDGKDEQYCQTYVDEFKVYKNSRLDVLERQRWDNVSYSTCALLCIDNPKFECKSFNYRKFDKTCFLTNENIGSSGGLKAYHPCDYYEKKSTSVDCEDMHKCPNGKCLTSDAVCDGYNDCGDRADERNCRAEDFGYQVRLAGSTEENEGRIEVTVFGKTGYICDDQFSITDADVLCKELGFYLGAAEVKGHSFFAKDLKENHTLYMMDDIECTGNETSLMHCDFAGWGIHNCDDKEIAGVICETPEETCSEGFWKCDTGNECVKLPFLCDDLDDCTDNSDEASHHCNAPTELRLVNGARNNEGRLEIKHHGIWGSICDDDFNDDAVKIACKSLGFSGSGYVKKDAYFGQSSSVIWLDQVSCFGNETSIEKCTHWAWGDHNCDHSEDVGIVCTDDQAEVEAQRSSKSFGGRVSGSIKNSGTSNTSPEPVSCGFRKDNIFLENGDVHFRVVQGSVARPGDYPWQAALRIQGQGQTAHWCGAVVISSKWVLTAAHCLEGYSKGTYMVVAGEYNMDEDEGTEQQAFIEEYYLHENFRKGHKMGNDIAMIKLKGKGFRLNQDIQPICLPDETADYERDLNCTISGFGTIQTGKSVYSHKLRAAWIPVQKMDVCRMAHIYGESIGEGMICAGDLTGGGDACDGDSGGPLACLDDGVFTLYGLTSWGQRCGYANKPGVYVKVSHYKKWIENIMKLHS